jgi:fructose-1,6-bisphosphatase/inositol monophosphatase family enzyme
MSSDEQKLLDEIYKTAFAASVKASELVLQYWPNPLNPHFDKNKVMKVFDKNSGIGNYATIADTESEELIMKIIRENPLLKDHSILAEESGGNANNSAYIWIIDPIDGTQNFKNGISDFGVSIGVIHNNVPVVGIIAMPALGHILAAKKGTGAKLLDMKGKKLLDLTKIVYKQTIDKSLVATDMGYTGRVKTLQTVIEKIADNVGYTPIYASSAACIGLFRCLCTSGTNEI